MIARFCKIDDRAVLPTKEEGAVGYDLYTLEDTIVQLKELSKIRTGLVAVPPPRFTTSEWPVYWEIYLRSSTPDKWGLLMPHGAGIIDPPYCGPQDELLIQVYRFCWGTQPAEDKLLGLSIPGHTKIAQLVLRHHIDFDVGEIKEEDLPKISRGGFGSSDGR